MSRKKILFVAENVTLAQVVRLVTLAESLDPNVYDIAFACSEFPDLIFGSKRFDQHHIYTVPKQQVMRASANGRRLYGKATLARYIQDELSLIELTQPDLIVGDLRWSLCVSAPVAQVPHAALINAYWSPYSTRQGFPLPDHPIVKLLGTETAARYFPHALPHVFTHFATPVNELRRRYGMSAIGSLPEVLTHGDYVLYADVPGIAPTHDLPPHHLYLGQVPWTPSTSLPEWWPALDLERPVVYATLGSSGPVDTLPLVLEALSRLPVTGLVATAGRANLSGLRRASLRSSPEGNEEVQAACGDSLHELPSNVFIADFLPGDRAARLANVVVSNGGSTTGYQALAEGTPVVGIASNFDQYLAMTAIEEAGAGVLVRAGTATVEGIRTAISRVLESEPHHWAAHLAQIEFSHYDSAQRFRDVVAEATGSIATTPRPSHLGLRSPGGPKVCSLPLNRSSP